MQELRTASIVRKSENGKLVLQKYQFVPYHGTQVSLHLEKPSSADRYNFFEIQKMKQVE